VYSTPHVYAFNAVFCKVYRSIASDEVTVCKTV